MRPNFLSMVQKSIHIRKFLPDVGQRLIAKTNYYIELD